MVPLLLKKETGERFRALCVAKKAIQAKRSPFLWFSADGDPKTDSRPPFFLFCLQEFPAFCQTPSEEAE